MRWPAVSQEQIDAGAARLAARALADEKRSARLRLTCAALTGMLACPDMGGNTNAFADDATAHADACLALLYPEVPNA